MCSSDLLLDGQSNALANAADTHGAAVTGKSEIRDKTDQFLLRFKKPANAPRTDKRPSEAESTAIMKNYYGNTVFDNVDAIETGYDKNGQQLRTVMYHADHTYEEFGPVGASVLPMLSGIWYWDAEGHNCMLHQFPVAWRSDVICHDHVFVQPIGKPTARNTDGSGGQSVILPGYSMRGIMPGGKLAGSRPN